MVQRTIGILGLGIFGQSILKGLKDQEVDVIAIDDHVEGDQSVRIYYYNRNCWRLHRY